MTSVYRTNNPPYWVGTGAPLTYMQGDQNMYDKETRVTTLENDLAALGSKGIGLDYFSESGGNLYAHMTDHSIQGPFPLPVAMPNWRNAWAPSTHYAVMDWFIGPDGKVYLVIFAHTSAGSFDPGANNGIGQNYYQLLWSASQYVIPPQVKTHLANVSAYTLQLSDTNTYNRFLDDHAVVVTVPAYSSVAFTVGAQIYFRQAGLGSITFVGAAGVTINTPSHLYTAQQNATVTLINFATDAWDLMGRLG